MKKGLFLSLLVLVLLGSGAFGAISLDQQVDKLLVDETHFTFGLGYAGNPFLGAVTKNGFGYPKSEFGFTNWAGFGYTWVFGVPSDEEIKDAVKTIKSEYGADIKAYELPKLVRQEIRKGTANYFTFGTVALILPINLEYGWMWYTDNVRFRFGFGLPILIAFGINFDF